MRRMTASV